MVEEWNSDGGTVGWNSGTVLVEQCGGTVEQCWLNSGTLMVEQCRWNSEVEQCWWNSGTVMVEHRGKTVEQ